MPDAFSKMAASTGVTWPGARGSGTPIWPTFDHPAWLLLIAPLCFAAWWIARRSLAGWGLTRRTMHLLIRCIVIALLCVALAEPRVRWRADAVAVVAVMDVSESVPGSQRRAADDFLAASLMRRPDKDRFGLVTIARDALVQSLPSAMAPRMEISGIGRVDASDLRKGVDMARALVPSDAAGRILLVTDGNETSGSLAAAAPSLLAAGIPIDVAVVDYDRSGMVRVEGVSVPAWAREGETINTRIILNAGRAASGRLSLTLNGSLVDLDPESNALSARVDLAAGLQVLSLPLRLPPGPVHRIEAIFEPDDRESSIPQLLRAEGVAFSSSRGRVLVLAEDASAAAPFAAAIASVDSESISVEVRSASLAPFTLEEWSGYDAVVLFNQPAFNFSLAQQETLARYVHDVGGGLLMVGGPESFGAGGWIGSPLEETLPVMLDPPQKRQMPIGALVLVIDRSGSMGSPVAGTGLDQQQIANEAAILGIRALSRLDQVAVIAFDDMTEVVSPLTPVGDPEAIARSIRSIGPRGGTNLFPAIDAAASELARAPGGVKHIIILTDGQTVGSPQEGLAKAAELRRRGITLSTVAIGDQSNDPLLAGMARTAGGRFYEVKSANSRAVLPQIIIKEAQTVRRTLIWEGPAFVPRIAVGGEAMRGIAGPLPGITGYVVTADRGGLSSVALRGPQGDPILAQWQHGLGRVTAFTSDAATRWNGAWAAWPAFGSFWEQQVKWVMRPSGDPNARVTVDARNERAKISLELTDTAGDRVNFAAIRARLVPPSVPGAESPPARDVTFRQVAPGRYEAEVDAAAAGSHVLSIRYDALSGSTSGEVNAEGRRSGSVRAAIVRRAGEEFRQPTPNTALLWDLARQTNGRVYRLDPRGADLWVREHLTMPEISRAIWLLMALAAVGLFLADVAARRISLDFAKMQRSIAALFGRAPDIGAASMATLAATNAKARAQARARESDRDGASERASAGLGSRERGDEGRNVPSRSATTHSQPAITPPRASVSASANTKPGTDADMMARLRAAKARSQDRTQDISQDGNR